MFELFAEPAFWASIVLIIGMELALGFDNIVFISALADRVPENQRKRVLRLGMTLAAVIRLILLAGVVWILSFERMAFSLAGWSPTWRELVLLFGGLFLIYKAVSELYLLVDERKFAMAESLPTHAVESGVAVAILQIMIANAVFSVDSIITAIGISPYVEAMAIAVIVSIAILYFATEAVSGFISRHPSVKGFALALLLVIGTVLVAEGLGMEVVRPYLYGAFLFGILVLASIKLVRRSKVGATSLSAVATATERNEPVVDIPEPVGERESAMSVSRTELSEPATEDVPEPESEAAVPEPDVEAPEPQASSELAEEDDITEPMETEAEERSKSDTGVGDATLPVPKSIAPRAPVRRKPKRRIKPKLKRDV